MKILVDMEGTTYQFLFREKGYITLISLSDGAYIKNGGVIIEVTFETHFFSKEDNDYEQCIKNRQSQHQL